MSRRKSRPAILPWLSARADNTEKRFIQPGNSLLLSPAFQSLSPGSRYLYLCMAMESGGRRRFLFPLAAGRRRSSAPPGPTLCSGTCPSCPVWSGCWAPPGKAHASKLPQSYFCISCQFLRILSPVAIRIRGRSNSI